jgi:hypothetical protein
MASQLYVTTVESYNSTHCCLHGCTKAQELLQVLKAAVTNACTSCIFDKNITQLLMA